VRYALRYVTVPLTVPDAWAALLAPELASPWFAELAAFVRSERARGPVYPPEADVFAALEHTPPDRVKVLLVGQDPYHGPNQAEGLAFSVRRGIKPPPSLVNMLKELSADIGCPVPQNGSLVPWADEGVLLLNCVLTVRDGEANSHKGKGWERFTDAVIRAVSASAPPAVFLLWGSHAKKKKALVDVARHRVIEGVHPSPLSAHGGFFGSRPYSRVNELLHDLGREPIRWSLPA
jgi:uracil-DNA glycosylase